MDSLSLKQIHIITQPRNFIELASFLCNNNDLLIQRFWWIELDVEDDDTLIYAMDKDTHLPT